MANSAELSTPSLARQHARAQAGASVRAMPTIPAGEAKDLPPGVNPADLVWDETIDGGEYCARRLQRGTRLRIANLDGDACVNLLVFNADCPIERLNVADTMKVQWNAYLGKGSLLLSDMGRVLMSIVEDTSGHHDAICGATSEKSNAAKYGHGENHGPFPSARDRFLLALLKFGLGKKDIPPSINLFKQVRINGDGSLRWVEHPPKPSEFVLLRAEMNVLVAVANTPHVLDPRSQYVCTAARLTAWHGPVTPADDPIRSATPEAVRAFQNTEDLFTI